MGKTRMVYRHDMRGYTPQQQSIVRQRDKQDKLLQEENEKRKAETKTTPRKPIDVTTTQED